MTPIEQQTAIAVALGYTYEDKSILYDWETMTFRLWRTPSGGGMARDWPPRYTESLDAMHEAEKHLSIGERASYARSLETVYGTQGQVFVTAEQKAITFLATLNLWRI